VKPQGVVTRGTTNANRLRRVDSWIAFALRPLLTTVDPPLVVDLGYGASPVTTLELRTRLARIRSDVRVVGLEIDPDRVFHALPYADPPFLDFRPGGFELAGLQPVLVRAMNVLRQYDESEVDGAWHALTASGSLLVEGTCDELGRLASWVLVGPEGPRSLTLAARLSTLDTPATLAERLPKALIHHNVRGTPVHALITALDDAWQRAAPLTAYGPRQRWQAAAGALRDGGWPVLDGPRRWRLGELSVDWSCVTARS
jgi:hypothetical protein